MKMDMERTMGTRRKARGCEEGHGGSVKRIRGRLSHFQQKPDGITAELKEFEKRTHAASDREEVVNGEGRGGELSHDE